MTKTINRTSPKVLGLDVSTRTIGCALFDIQSKELLELTHVSPVPKPKVENKIEELLIKSDIFRKKLEEYVGMGITHVVIEEPLLNSNNVYTVGTLIRFNTIIQENLQSLIWFKKMIRVNLFYLVDYRKISIRKSLYGN
jgi:RNase H-fold protein (predicted Holliday junction resolvase)